jgi:hypothetical protein
MTGVFSRIRLYPLQDISYFKEDDPIGATILLVSIGAMIIIAFVISFIRNGVQGVNMGKGKSRVTVTPRKFNTFTLHKIAAAYGLNKDQTKLLEYIFRNDSVSDPLRVMNNPGLLDKHFKQVYKTIEKNAESDDDAQEKFARLFALRNIIEASPNTGGGNSGDQISENMTVVLSTDQDSYSVKVISSKREAVIVEPPRNALGTPVRIPKGARIKLSFFTKGSKGFALESRVMGNVDTPLAKGLQLSYSGRAKPLAQRRYRRRRASCGCVFFLVYVDSAKANKKSPPKLIVDSRRFSGTVLDISIGGCSMKTGAAIQVGSRLKLEIDYSDNFIITCLGQVLRTNRSGAAGTIAHIKFLKVPRRAFNAINAMVFGFDED